MSLFDAVFLLVLAALLVGIGRRVLVEWICDVLRGRPR